MRPQQGVRARTALLVAPTVTAACWLVLQLADRAGLSAPVISWIGLVALVALIGLVLVLSWQIRRYVKGSGTFRPSPQRGRGTLVGTQAAALGGAALVGWYAGNALMHLPNADVPSVRGQLILWAVHAGVAALLSVAGFVGQAWCRIPGKGEDDDEPGGEGDLAYG